MSKKNFLIVVILLTNFLSGCSLQSTSEKILTPITKKPSPKLLLDSCCASGEKWCKNGHSAYSICPNDYETKCKDIGGALHKEGSLASGLTTFSCNESASDVGKACANDNECFYTCDLYSSIKNNLCSLKKTEKSEDYTTEIYNCSTDKPGVCSPTPIYHNIDCGGAKFELNGKNLRIIMNHNSC